MIPTRGAAAVENFGYIFYTSSNKLQHITNFTRQRAQRKKPFYTMQLPSNYFVEWPIFSSPNAKREVAFNSLNIVQNILL